MHNKQIQRIKEKLTLAKEIDKEQKVYGASSHKYHINKPVSLDEIKAFEKEFGINLPTDFVAFLIQIGNGGIGWQESAAGPFQGILPLDKLIKWNNKERLNNTCVLHPEMTDKEWKDLIKEDALNLTDEEYDSIDNIAYGGLLNIGSQGCAFDQQLIINGPLKGRMVNTDGDMQKPVFAYDTSFLDWYEHWLDEIIDKTLPGSHWYGYLMPGNQNELLSKFKKSTSEKEQNDILDAFSKFKEIDTEKAHYLSNFLHHSNSKIANKVLYLAGKTDFNLVEEKIKELINGNSEEFQEGMEFLYHYNKDYVKQHTLKLLKLLPTIEDHSFFIKVFELVDIETEDKSFYTELLKPEHPKRVNTLIYHISKLENKAKYLPIFLELFNAPKTFLDVYKITLIQALSGLEDESQIPLYKRLLKSYPELKEYMVSNIFRRLTKLGEHAFDEELIQFYDGFLDQIKNDYTHELRNLLINLNKLKIFKPTILKAKNHPDPSVQKHAQWLLGEIESVY